jgi:hypothetical protein
VGVTLNNSIRSNDGDIDTSFVPASTFAVVNNGLPFSFVVTGDRVPTGTVAMPATATLFAVGMMALVRVRRERARA